MSIADIIVLMLAAAGIVSVAYVITNSIMKMIDAVIARMTMKQFLDDARHLFNDYMSDLMKSLKDFES